MSTIAIVTGGANGLGLELVRILHRNGFFVCNVDRDKYALTSVDAEFRRGYKSFCGDVSDEDFVLATIDEISKLGEIRVLINCAGSPSFKLPTEYTAKDVDLCFEGLKGMIYFCANALKHMERYGGKVVNIMSSAALRGNSKESVYCATKWGERGYTESLKAAYAGSNIQIYGVYPGGINTNFYKNSRDYVSYEKQRTFMPASDLAQVIFDNVFADKNLIVEDLIINRIKRNSQD